MILGNPSKFEVYAYTHFRNNRGLISIRNPANTEQGAKVELTEENGFWDMPSSPLRARQIYPCEETIAGTFTRGNSLTFSLQPYETKVIELGPPTTAANKISRADCQ
jgi:hypothetical protein